MGKPRDRMKVISVADDVHKLVKLQCVQKGQTMKERSHLAFAILTALEHTNKLEETMSALLNHLTDEEKEIFAER